MRIHILMDTCISEEGRSRGRTAKENSYAAQCFKAGRKPEDGNGSSEKPETYKNTQDMLCIYTFLESGYLSILIRLLILILHLITMVPLLGIRRIQP